MTTLAAVAELVNAAWRLFGGVGGAGAVVIRQREKDMITHSGIHIQKIGGVEGTPTATDIAVHAGRICRFGGAIWEPNLTHLVFVGLLAYSRSNSYPDMLWGFLHDAHEGITGEIPRPFKCDCMRAEQRAIDARLMPMFNLSPEMIDFDLIKRCDGDACDIEAVELGLPGYAETEVKYAADYKGAKKIHRSYDDTKLFRQILMSPFYQATTGGHLALGPWHFAEMLKEAQAGDIDAVMERVHRWLASFKELPVGSDWPERAQE